MGYDDDRSRRDDRIHDRQRSPRPEGRRYGPSQQGQQTPEREVRTVREVKTKHGTRVSRRITCVRCKADDREAFIPRNAAQMLCRKCAASELDIADPAAGIRPEKEATCDECGRVEMTTFLDVDPYLCRDCHRGIYSNQDDRNKRAEPAGGRTILRVRRDS